MLERQQRFDVFKRVCLGQLGEHSSHVYKEMEKIEILAKAELGDIVWHNLNRIKPLYAATLGILFPDDLNSLYQAISVRHDLVHRNGKTKSGDPIVTSVEEVASLIEQVNAFVSHMDEQLPQSD